MTSLEKGESQITGEEKLARLKESGNVLYCAKVFLSLWEDYQTNKENSVLEYLYHQEGITYIDFFGDVPQSPDGGRSVLCLCRDGDDAYDDSYNDSWYWYDYLLEDDWYTRFVSVVSQQVS